MTSRSRPLPRHRALPILTILALGACTADDLAREQDDELADDESSAGDDESSSDDGSDLDDDVDDALELDRGPSQTRRGPTTRNTIASGLTHTCVARRDGTVRCWGMGTSGQLGNGSSSNSNVPVAVSNLANVTEVAAGEETSLALRSDGTVWRWGVRWAVAGDPFDNTPQQVAGISGATAVAAGGTLSCALRSDGHVLCWGTGTLGDGASTSSDTPVEVAGIGNAVAIDLGSQDNGCALLASGGVKCWGDNQSGQIGDGTWTDATTPVLVSGISTAIDISTDAAASCAVLADGHVRCWGSNAGGMLGIGTLMPDASPTSVQVQNISNAREVKVGWTQFVCALLADGTEQCWGRNDAGQLGNDDGGYTHKSTIPVDVLGLDRVASISAGGHACSLRSDGTARCWGPNSSGQLGDGSFVDSDVPVTVSGLTAANDGPRVAAGPHHTCALRSDGTAKCWGDNSQGQLGNGNQVDQSTPVAVAGLSGVAGLAAGGTHTCALLDDGGVRCWGRNVAGELGDGGASGILSLSPVTVSGLTDAVQIAAAQQASCAIRSNGTAMCWGNNQYGQLGRGSYVDSNVPVAVSGLSGAIAIDMNNIHVCALTTSGWVKCWGYNFYGQLGNGNSGAGQMTNAPVTVTTGGFFNFPLVNAVAIGVGNSHSCAVLSDGTARCWGAGFDGGLGNGSWNSQVYPVTVSGLSDAYDIALGSSSTCALRTTGGARCWGTNTYGELGHGAVADTNSPVTVGVFPIYLSNAIAIDSGFDNTCVAKGNGAMSCWGLNADGQLGDGTTTNRNTPVTVSAFP